MIHKATSDTRYRDRTPIVLKSALFTSNTLDSTISGRDQGFSDS